MALLLRLHYRSRNDDDDDDRDEKEPDDARKFMLVSREPMREVRLWTAALLRRQVVLP